MNDTPFQLITNNADADIAAEHRLAIVEASKPLMTALSNARKDGFISQLNFGEDAFHQIVIMNFQLLKSF
jgi:hypothetical protein